MTWAMSYWLEAGPYWGNKVPPDLKYDIMDRLPGSEPDNPMANYWRMPSNPSDPGPWTIQKYFTYSYEPKILGAFCARRVQMWPEDLVNYPPFGNVKLQTPHNRPHSIGTIKVHMKAEPIYISPHMSLWKAKQKLNRGEPIEISSDDISWIRRQYAQMTPTYITPEDNIWGQRVRKIAPGWLSHTEPLTAEDLRNFINDDMREVAKQLNELRRARWDQKLPKYAAPPQKAKPQTRDLFA